MPTERDNHWTEHEDTLLKTMYLTNKLPQLVEFFPNRTAYAIQHRSGSLGLTRQGKKGKPWTKEEEAILREKYLTHSAPELYKLLPGRSPNAIHPKANSMGLIKQEKIEPIQDYNDTLFLPSEGEKRCIQCGVVKPYSQFYKEKNGC